MSDETCQPYCLKRLRRPEEMNYYLTSTFYEDYHFVHRQLFYPIQYHFGNNKDQLYSLQQTKDGGYILGGYSYPTLQTEKSRSILQQPVDAITWQRTTRAGKNSSASAYMDNFKYAANNRIDNLITPLIAYSGADSVFLKFDLAAVTYSFPGSTAIPLDTLEVLATLDCGKTFTSIYKKWGFELQTIGNPNSQNLTEFYPNNSQWRTDSINVTTLLGSTNKVRFAFRNTTNFENNIFIDNVNFRTKVLPASLKQNGFLINPSPFTNSFAIQSFNVTDLKAYAIYNGVGQLVKTRSYTGRAENFIEINMQNQPAGMYTVKLFYSNRTISRKVIKVN